MNDTEKKPVRGTFIQAMKAVSWAFFGVRKHTDHDNDAATLKVGQVIIAGIIGAVLFVAVIVIMVKLVTS